MTKREVKSLIERQTKSLKSYKTRVDIQNDLIREQQARIEALEKELETLRPKEKPRAESVKNESSPFAKVTDKRGANKEVKNDSGKSYADRKRLIVGGAYMLIGALIVFVMAIKPEVMPSTHAWLHTWKDGIRPSFLSLLILAVSLGTCCAFIPFMKLWAGVLVEALILSGLAWDNEVPWLIGMFLMFVMAFGTGMRLMLPAVIPQLKQMEFFRMDEDEKEVAKK